MRELKFRAWDKKENKMLEVDSIELKGELNPIFGLMTKPAINKHKPLDNIHLMQYTGLKDKNGKEIYEGDILKVDGCYQDNFIVRYHSPCFVLFDGVNGVLPNSDFTWQDWVKSEVIGNLHQNPELLEDK